MTHLSDQQTLTDTHDMVVVHRAFRREFAVIPRLVRAVAPGDVTRAGVVAQHTRLVLDGLHLHHTGEDVMLWPVLVDRAAPAAEVIHRMEQQHQRIEELVDLVPAALTRWEAEARPAVAAELATTVEELRTVVVDHLDDEEVHILPLAAQHFSPSEWAAIGQHGIGEMDKAQVPILFGMILEDATPDERRMMLTGLPVPARIFLRTVGTWQYRRYVRSVRGG